jgi:formylglycine-generating enzyme required for sulfatase activity
MNSIYYFLLALLCIASNANAEVGTRFKDCPQCPEMVVIPAGGFQMGAQGSGEDALPVHHVKINSAFALATTEVTQGQWKWIMGNNPSFFQNCGDDCPVEKVSWDVVHEFIQQLNARTGQQGIIGDRPRFLVAKCKSMGSITFDSRPLFDATPQDV